MSDKFLLGQRVIVDREIGTVVDGDGAKGSPPPAGYVWVFRPSKGFASCFVEHNVKPLPNGQL